MIIKAKQAFFAWMQNNFTNCELHIQQTIEPASDTWLRIWIFQEFTRPTPKTHDRVYDLDINFSFFSSDTNSLYLMDSLMESLSELIENRTICFESGKIEFREFSTMSMGPEKAISSHGFRQAAENKRIIQHESIMVKAILYARRA